MTSDVDLSFDTDIVGMDGLLRYGRVPYNRAAIGPSAKENGS